MTSEDPATPRAPGDSPPSGVPPAAASDERPPADAETQALLKAFEAELAMKRSSRLGRSGRSSSRNAARFLAIFFVLVLLGALWLATAFLDSLRRNQVREGADGPQTPVEIPLEPGEPTD